MTLLAIGVSHRTAPLALRERVQLTDPEAATLLASLTQHRAISEAAALSTCNRTEVYVAAPEVGEAEAVTIAALASGARVSCEELGAATSVLRGSDAARHLFRVAAGLDSMVVGEAEIQGQVRRSYELALSLRTSGPVTNHVFQAALHVGKRVRSETAIPHHGPSVAAVAVALARDELGDLSRCRALVIGAGRHATLMTRALTGAGMRTVFVASRARGTAEALARRFGGRAVGFGELSSELRRCDLVLTCTSCPCRILTGDQLLAAAAGRRLVVVDTAVPRDVAPEARDLPGVTLFDLDDIQRAADRDRVPGVAASGHAEALVDEEVALFERWLASLEVVPTISALRERGRAAVDRALRQNERRWSALTEDDRRRVELVARAVASDLLHEPTLHLRRAGERGSSRAYAETVRELFGLATE